MADANNDTAENAREVETLQAKRSAEVDCDGSVSHVSSAACSSPLSPQQWAPRLAASLEDARFRGQGICGPLLEGSQPGISSDATASGSCLVDADRDNISGIQLPCCQSSFSQGLRLVLRGFRQARVRSGCWEQSRCRMQSPGHCRRESFKKEDALEVGAYNGRPSGAGLRSLGNFDQVRCYPS